MKIAVTFLLTFIFFSPFTHAASDFKAEEICPPPAFLADGFYVGFQMGYDSYKIHGNVATNFNTQHSSVNATGWAGGLVAGYGQSLSSIFYVGGEVFANYTDAASHYISEGNNIFLYRADFNGHGTYGVSLLPGVRLSSTLLGFVKLGYNWGNVQVKETLNSTQIKKNRSRSGFHYGLGMEAYINERWSLRGEYSHLNYGRTRTVWTSYDVTNNQFMVGLIYHFR